MQKMTQIDRQHLHAEMRQARANGETIRAIAAKFGVHRCVAHLAVRDIEPQPPEPVSVHDLVCTPSGEYRPVFVVKTPFRRGGFRVIDGHYSRDVWGQADSKRTLQKPAARKLMVPVKVPVF